MSLRTSGSWTHPDFPFGTFVFNAVFSVVVVVAVMALEQDVLQRLDDSAADIVEMQRLRGEILHLDEVLTMSARMAATTSQARWMTRYERAEPQLDDAIKQLTALAATHGLSGGSEQTDAANQALVDIERQALGALKAGDPRRARELLFSPVYEDLKASYEAGMTSVLARVTDYADQTAGQRRGLLATLGAANVGVVVLLVVLWGVFARRHRSWRLAWKRAQVDQTEELQLAEQQRLDLRAELDDTEQLLALMVRQAPLVLFALDPNGIFEYSDGAMLEHVGLEPGEAVGQSVFTLYADQPELLVTLRQALSGTPAKFESHIADVWFLTVLQPIAVDDEPGRFRVVGVAVDATEVNRQRHVNHQLTESLEHSPAGTALLDASGAVLYVNSRFCELAGQDRDALQGAQWRQLLSRGERDPLLDKALRDVAERGRVFRGDMPLRDARGEHRWVHVQARRLRVDGEVLFVIVAEDISELRATQTRLEEQALTDALTGLPNRAGAVSELQRMIGRSGGSAGVVHLDLDHFKRINDALGPSLGDALLLDVVHRLDRALPEQAVLARLGGDEFALCCPAADQHDLATVARAAQRALEPPFSPGGQAVSLTVSAGLALLPQDASDAREALRCAESAAYTAKSDGRNCFRFFQAALNASSMRQLTVESRLRRAIETNALQVHYQPLLRLSDGQVIGAEALVRWHDDDLGFVSPGEFIPLAESLNLIGAVARLVFGTACDDAGAWAEPLRAAGYDAPLRVALNCSAQQLHDAEFIDLLLGCGTRCGQPSQHFELEITERVVMNTDSTVVETLNRLAEAGYGLSLDDFGTGYSALSYLKQYPFDTVKIDRSFVADVMDNPSDAALCQAIIGMARALGLKTVAEGLETEDQVRRLRELGADIGQGFYYAPAMPADAFVDWVVARSQSLAKTD